MVPISAVTINPKNPRELLAQELFNFKQRFVQELLSNSTPEFNSIFKEHPTGNLVIPKKTVLQLKDLRDSTFTHLKDLEVNSYLAIADQIIIKVNKPS